MVLPAAHTERLMILARAVAAAPHGAKGALYREAAAELGVSPQTLQKWMKTVTINNLRKRRSDAGSSALTLDEAHLVAACLMESHRRNGKRLASIEWAVEVLRTNGLIRAGCVDAGTGEIKLLSTAAIGRALRAYGLHPDTLLQPAPAIGLASKHPNHVWQIDASLCVLYYLRSAAAERGGLQVMESKEFYKNKPANVAKIENERVWRYAITDHTSGHIYLEYVLGAESGENLCSVFINAICPRPGEPVHGVPYLAMLDPGSANTGALFKNLCRALTVRVQINQVGNPRAKGQVEKAHDMIEKTFESGLKFVTVNSLEELNAAAATWRQWFNGTSIHSRHGRTRYEQWMKITADQLRLAPAAALCRELATTAPEERTVSAKLQVSFRGALFDVSVVPHIQNGDKALVCRNPWRPEAAQVVSVDADGREVFYVVEPVLQDEHGFDQGSPVIGENYARHADTPAQRAAKTIEKLLMDEPTLEGAAAARKAKRLGFGGRVKPWKHMEEGAAQAPAYLPRRGSELETPLPGIVARRSSLDVPAAMIVEAETLSTIQAAGRLRDLVPGWSTEHYRALARDYPQGIMESELPALAERFNGLPKVAAVGGASA